MIYEKLPVLLLSTIAAEPNDAVNSIIARRILEDPAAIAGCGIKEMAVRFHVGVSTLSRFCRSIGLADFEELRELLRNTDLSSGISATDALQHLEEVTGAIEMTTHSVSDQALEELCHDLKKYPSVSAFGLLKAMSAAISFQTDMCMLKRPVYTNLAFSEQLNRIRNAGPDDLILLFSYTGTYFDILPERISSVPTAPRIWMICGRTPSRIPPQTRILSFASEGTRNGHPYQLLMASDMIVEKYRKLYHC